MKYNSMLLYFFLVTFHICSYKAMFFYSLQPKKNGHNWCVGTCAIFNHNNAIVKHCAMRYFFHFIATWIGTDARRTCPIVSCVSRRVHTLSHIAQIVNRFLCIRNSNSKKKPGENLKFNLQMPKTCNSSFQMEWLSLNAFDTYTQTKKKNYRHWIQTAIWKKSTFPQTNQTRFHCMSSSFNCFFFRALSQPPQQQEQ